MHLNADKHSPASSAQSTKRRLRGGCFCQWELKAPTDRTRSDCVHEQVAKRIANVRFTADKHSPASSVRNGSRMSALQIKNCKNVSFRKLDTFLEVSGFF